MSPVRNVVLGCAAVCWAAACCGCGPAPGGSAATSGSGGAAVVTAGMQAAKPAPFREYWEEHFIQNAKVGHTHTAYYRDVLAGEPVVRIESTSQMSLVRTNQKIEQALDNVSWETEAGEVRRFRHTMLAGGAAQTTEGVVHGEEAVLTSSGGGNKPTATKIPWPKGTLGEAGVNDEVRRRPLAPGESRTIAMFVPVLNQIAQVSLAAREREQVDVGAERRELLRVEMKATLSGGIALDSTAWIDGEGNVLKSFMPGLQQTTIRTTAASARAVDPAGPQLDLGFATKVPTTPPLKAAQETKLVRYRVQVTGSDAAALFPVGETQQVRKLENGAAEVTVAALRPDSPRAAGVVIPPPTDDDRLPNRWIQSDDPRVVRLAAEAAAGETDPWRAAVNMEKYLRARWRTLPISSAFATASDAARSLTGDCTEFAVLLAAMLRAHGIPARTAIGLIYVDGEQAFLYHMWTEAYLAQRWIPLDAAWGRGGTSAAYLKIAQTNLAGVDPLAAMLSVAQVMGRLKIEVLEQR